MTKKIPPYSVKRVWGIYKNRIDYMIVLKMFGKCCIDLETGLGTKIGRNRVDFTTDSGLLFLFLKRRFVEEKELKIRF